MKFYLRLIDRTLWTDSLDPVDYDRDKEGMFSFVAVCKKRYWYFWHRWTIDKDRRWYTFKPELFKVVSELTAERIENARQTEKTVASSASRGNGATRRSP
jgi:hypothetical protein